MIEEEQIHDLNSNELHDLDCKVARRLGLYVHKEVFSVEGTAGDIHPITQWYISKDRKKNPDKVYSLGGLPPYSGYLGAATRVILHLRYNKIPWQMGSNFDGSFYVTLHLSAGPGVLIPLHRVSTSVEAALCLAFIAIPEFEGEVKLVY